MTTPDSSADDRIAKALLTKVGEIAAAKPDLASGLVRRHSAAEVSVASISSPRLDAARRGAFTPPATRPSLRGSGGSPLDRVRRTEAGGGARLSSADGGEYLGGHRLTYEGAVQKADSEQEVLLARGVTEWQLAQCKSHDSDPMTTAPSEREAVDQVGEAQMYGSVVEFTSDPSVAVRFSTWFNESRKNYVIVVKIKRKYLTKGSRTEAGWICRSNAPYEVVSEAVGRRAAH